MNLSELIDIQENEVISVVGCNGKTTLIEILANELPNKVLISPTTKIYLPHKENVIISDEKALKYYPINGTQYLGNIDVKQNKLTALKQDTLSNIINRYDYVLLEADGSNKKPIKAYKTNEPVIIKESSLTIGVINIKAVNMKLGKDNTHNYQLLLNDLNKSSEDYFNFDDLVYMINEMFRNTKNRKVLIINFYQEEDYELCLKLKDNIKNIEEFIVADLLKKTYKIL